MPELTVSGTFKVFGLFHKARVSQKTAWNPKGSRFHLGESKTLHLFQLLHFSSFFV